MIFDNGWVSVEEVDKLPPHGKLCQVLLMNREGKGEALATAGYMDRDYWVTGDARSKVLAVIAHQPLAEVPTPTKPTLAVRLAAQTARGMTTGMALKIIKFIDEERAKDAPFGKDDMRNLRKCYARALAYNPADEIASLLLAIQRLEGET